MPQGNTFNLPNFVGELFAISPLETPILSALGGLTGGKSINSTEFAIQKYALPDASQPSNLEGQAAPDAVNVSRTQDTNVVQIFHEAIEVSYTKQAATANISGASILGVQPVQDELAWQTQVKLQKIARDVEYSMVNGVFNMPADNTGARKMRGLINVPVSNVINVAAGTALSKATVQSLLTEMFGNGAVFSDKTVICVNGNQADRLNDAFGVQPRDFQVGGVQVKSIYTTYGIFPVMIDRYMPNDAVGVFDLACCEPYLLEVPQKGFLFREQLALTGSSTKYQIYGEIGLQHGPENRHGIVRGLTA